MHMIIHHAPTAVTNATSAARAAMRLTTGTRPAVARAAARWAGMLLAALLFAAGGAARGAEGDAPARPPNIIWIMADDLGYGDVGCYGQEQIATPRIDRLAAEGLRFTDFYAGSTVCAPSRCALVTGLHTGHCRVRGNSPRVPLEPDDVTVAELLRSAGYTCGIVGKWGLGNEETTGIPTRQGFDYWYGYLDQKHAHNYYPDFLWRNTSRVDLPGNTGGRRETYSHDLIVDEALAFLERQAAGPFFLYVALTLPHANNERGRETGNGMEVPDDAPYTDRPWPQPQKNHAAMIARVDSATGQIVDRLAALGIDQDTIVFFTSDNGPHREGGARPEFFASSGPLRGIKRDLYEGGIRVPMIVRWRGHVAPGTTSDLVWAAWDFPATAVELAGSAQPVGDGLSIVPTLLGAARSGREQQQHEYLYWEFHEQTFLQALRADRWKAIRHEDGRIELYDLMADLGEEHDLAPQHPQRVRAMAALFDAARTASPHWPGPSRP